MSLPVFWAPGTPLVAGSTVRLGGEEARHAVVVRRLRVGEPVELVDGAGTRATGRVAAAARDALDVALDAVALEPEPSPHVTVVQAIPKGTRGELAAEVLTEVGVDRIVPWAAERCVAVWRGERAEKSRARWAATAVEAAKQSRRSRSPEVTAQASTAEVAALLARADLAVVLHEDAAAALATLAVPGSGSVVVVVGPEGGIGPDELATLTGGGRDPGDRASVDALQQGVVVARLGDTVLRTSTAGLAAVSALLSRTPRWH